MISPDRRNSQNRDTSMLSLGSYPIRGGTEMMQSPNRSHLNPIDE
jgi:hypothetical protein